MNKPAPRPHRKRFPPVKVIRRALDLPDPRDPQRRLVFTNPPRPERHVRTP